MSARSWLLRDRLAQVVVDAPAPPATWASVVRRTAVIVGFFAAGLAADQLSLAVLAAFGALQAGLVEAALPFGALVRRLALMTVVSVVMVFVAMLLGGTWWGVVFIALLAYVFGCTAGMSAGAMTVGISALALSVIFAGMPQSPRDALVNAAWVGIGMVVQSVTWLIVWRWERRMLLRRALAIKIRTDEALLRHGTIEVRSLLRTHDASASVEGLLTTACFPEDEERALRRVFSDAISVSRAFVAWLVVQAPGAQERMTVSLCLLRAARALDDLPSRQVAAAVPPAEAPPTVRAAVDSVAVSAFALMSGTPAGPAVPSAKPPGLAGYPAPLHAPAMPKPVVPPPTFRDYITALLPRRHGGGQRALSRHGLRMLVGLGIAEALTMLLPIQHSFWLPLTVVFTLRPDWSDTVVRGLNRTLGNLAAVVILPVLLMTFGVSHWLLIVPLVVLSAVMFRYFFGNYVLASFGLAGSVLLLDYSLNPDESLFAIRIVAAILGAVLSLIVALAIPTWSSRHGPAQVDALETALSTWHAGVVARVHGTDEVSDAALERDMAASRQATMALEPTVNGALLEPRRGGRPVELAMVLAAGSRVHTHLMAITCFALSGADRPSEGDESVAFDFQRLRLHESLGDFQSAVDRFRGA